MLVVMYSLYSFLITKAISIPTSTPHTVVLVKLTVNEQIANLQFLFSLIKLPANLASLLSQLTIIKFLHL